MMREILLQRVATLIERTGTSDQFPLLRILEVILPNKEDEIAWARVEKYLNVEGEIIRLLTEQSHQPANWIHAIKLYRELTGEGLRESKEAVEQIAQKHHLCLCSIESYGGVSFRTACGKHKSLFEFCEENRERIRDTFKSLHNFRVCQNCLGDGIYLESLLTARAECMTCLGVGYIRK